LIPEGSNLEKVFNPAKKTQVFFNLSGKETILFNFKIQMSGNDR
jgi:hypothetical protein